MARSCEQKDKLFRKHFIMIFLTIGTQEPFDRLLRAVDEIAGDIGEEIIAQGANTLYKPESLKLCNFLDAIEFDQIFRNASMIISHAGMGTIISALRIGKPLIVMPRLASLHEHRNDHQMATAKKLDSLGYINVAYNEDELKLKVLEHFQSASFRSTYTIGDDASPALINSIGNYINQFTR